MIGAVCRLVRVLISWARGESLRARRWIALRAAGDRMILSRQAMSFLRTLKDDRGTHFWVYDPEKESTFLGERYWLKDR